MNTTATAFDTEALRRGIEERDADTHARPVRAGRRDDGRGQERPAEPPARPARPHARSGSTWTTTCGRDMTHRLERVVVSGDTAAFAQACRYPDGTSVLCLAMLDLRDGLIVRQTAVQAMGRVRSTAMTQDTARPGTQPDTATSPPRTRCALSSHGRLELLRRRRQRDRPAGPPARLALVGARQADRRHGAVRSAALPVPRGRHAARSGPTDGEEFDAVPGSGDLAARRARRLGGRRRGRGRRRLVGSKQLRQVTCQQEPGGGGPGTA